MKTKQWVASTGAAIAVSLATSLLAVSSAQAFTTIDFEDLDNGEVVNGQYSSQGVTISAENVNRGFDLAVAFDTNVTPTEDPDLLAPFYDFIQSDFNNNETARARSFAGDVRDGVNGMINPGKILIIQENNEGCGDGVCDRPDDEANRPNGAFEIGFDAPVFLSSIDFFDVESEEDGSPETQITLKTVTGEEVFFTPNTGGDYNFTTGIASDSGLAFRGAGSVNSWDRTFFNIAAVTMIRINMGGSGGIDNIRFSKDVPVPASIALLAMGLLVLRRKKA